MRDADWKLLSVLHSCNNITKTSELIHVSQPSVTKRIQQIEDEFGVKIVNRSTKGITFTSQGEYLAKCAERFISNLEKIKYTVLEMTDEYLETLRISAPNSYIGSSLPELLNGFKAKHKDVKFDVKAELSSNILKQVELGSVHIGFVNGNIEGKYSGGKCRVRFEQAYVISSSPIELSELAHMSRIEHNRDIMTLRIIDSWWEEYFGQPPIVGMKVNHQETTIQMIKNGFGYGVFFTSNLNAIPGELYFTPLIKRDGTSVTRDTWMLYPNDLQEKKLLEEFVEYVKELKASLN